MTASEMRTFASDFLEWTLRAFHFFRTLPHAYFMKPTKNFLDNSLSERLEDAMNHTKRVKTTEDPDRIHEFYDDLPPPRIPINAAITNVREFGEPNSTKHRRRGQQGVGQIPPLIKEAEDDVDVDIMGEDPLNIEEASSFNVTPGIIPNRRAIQRTRLTRTFTFATTAIPHAPPPISKRAQRYKSKRKSDILNSSSSDEDNEEPGKMDQYSSTEIETFQGNEDDIADVVNVSSNSISVMNKHPSSLSPESQTRPMDATRPSEVIEEHSYEDFVIPTTVSQKKRKRSQSMVGVTGIQKSEIDNKTDSKSERSRSINPVSPPRSASLKRRRSKSIGPNVSNLPISPSKVFGITQQQIQELYESLRPIHYTKMIDQPSELSSQLFNYQRKAVHWMASRENDAFKEDGVRGGILADEMGLGKTLELVGLVVTNKREHYTTKNDILAPPPLYDSILPSQHEPVDPLPQLAVDSKSTLIICPAILMQQWQDEISFHCPDLPIYVYHGVSKLSPSQKQAVNIGEDIFKNYSIVLTSYDTLGRDLPYSAVPNVATRASPFQISTPLKLIRWWRICIDESQMCKQGMSNAAQMARKLNAVNRWAASGTPVSTVNDIKGLFLFLGCADNYIRDIETIFSFFKKLAWRHSRSHVVDEITIPAPVEHTIDVTLSEIETYFFRTLQSKYKLFDPLFASSTPINFNTDDDSSILNDVISLQSGKFSSCPHQTFNDSFLGKNGAPALSTQTNTAHSMSTYLSSELYSSQLGVCRALNHLGDLNLVLAQIMRCTDQAGKSASQLSSSYQLDPYMLSNKAFQFYDQAYNFATYKAQDELVQLSFPGFVMSPPSVPFSVVSYHSLINCSKAAQLMAELDTTKAPVDNNVFKIIAQAEAAKKLALQSSHQSLATKSNEFDSIKKQVSRLLRNRENNMNGCWWHEALDWIGKNEPDFCHSLRKGVRQMVDFKTHSMRESVLTLNVSTTAEVADKLDLDLAFIVKTRNECVAAVKAPLPTCAADVPPYLVALKQAINATSKYEKTLLPVEEGTKIKMLNLAERLMLFIESLLVSRFNALLNLQMRMLDLMPPDEQVEIARISRVSLMAAANFRELELMKLEFKAAYALLEAKTSFCVDFEEIETSSSPEHAFPTLKATGTELLDPIELEHALSSAMRQLEVARSICLTRKRQLEFMLRQHEAPVPSTMVYGSKLDALVKYLIQILLPAYSTIESSSSTSTMYDSAANQFDMNDSASILSSQSNSQHTQRPPKALVFSKWSEPLVQLSMLLPKAGIEFRFGKDVGGSSNSSLPQRISEFKTMPNVQVLLLNALSQSTGLTLTQANHIFILEDLETPHEQQAIGRAYRIGQTKTTHIYKFNVKEGILSDFSH